MKSIYLVLFFTLFLPANILANPDCTQGLRVDPVDLTLTPEHKNKLTKYRSSLNEFDQNSFDDAIGFFIPRLPFTQSRIEDLIYTLDFLSNINDEPLEPDVISFSRNYFLSKIELGSLGIQARQNQML